MTMPIDGQTNWGDPLNSFVSGVQSVANTTQTNLVTHQGATDPHNVLPAAQTQTTAAVNGHVAATDPHGDRAYANTTFATAAKLGQPSGIATLDSTGHIPSAQMPTGSVASPTLSTLVPWYEKLGNRHMARANIAVIGDSITEGQGSTTDDAHRYVARLRAALRNLCPTTGVGTGGGRGFIAPLSTGEISFPWPTSSTGAITTLSGYGPKGVAWQLSSGMSVTWNLVGDSADIMWVQSPFSNSFSYQVDGGSSTTVSTYGATVVDGQITHVPLGSAGSHTLTITGPSTFTAFIDGVIEYNGDYSSGIQVHDCGHFGWNTSSWMATTPWVNAIAALNPGLITICLGANDLLIYNSATFKTNIQSMIAAIRGVLTTPYPPFMLLFMGDRSDPHPYDTWAMYIAAGQSIASADPGVCVCDLTTAGISPAVSASPNYGWWSDSVHPSNLGHSVAGDWITRFITPKSLF